MIFELIITIFAKIFAITYKWLDHHLIVYILNFVKGFESVIIVIANVQCIFNTKISKKRQSII
jgi:hypothetical protein